MPSAYSLRIVTPARTLFTGRVESLKAPGSEGSFGVLDRHAPMIAALGIGPLDFVEGGTRRHVATSGGFVEVSGDGVTVLAETAEFGEDIDVARAEAARDRARERLVQREQVDVARAEAALSRAMNRLRVATDGV